MTINICPRTGRWCEVTACDPANCEPRRTLPASDREALLEAADALEFEALDDLAATLRRIAGTPE